MHDVHATPLSSRGRLLALGIAAIAMLVAGAANARGGYNICKATSRALFQACTTEADDDFKTALAVCINITDFAEMKECFGDSRSDRREQRDECGEVRAARYEVCDDLGPDAYDPQLDPNDFVAVVDNPLAPFKAGAMWVYEGETEDGLERVVVEVQDETYEIAGIEATVVRDRVFLDGELVEDTFDWVAQDKDGNVWYLGESVADYEDGFISSTDGSFKHGEDGAKAGFWVLGSPEAGDVFRQEWAPGDAEDMVEILSVDAAEDVPFKGDAKVLKTRDYTPLEPGHEENKFYVPGIGLVKEISLETGETIELIDFSL